jgi:hypothetical protein
MAARQDQTLVISLIVFVCIAVIGVAWGYLMYKSSSDAHKQLTDTQQRLTEKDNALRNTVDENQQYRAYLGLGEQDSFDDVKATYDEDMKQYGGTFDESQQSYRNILITVFEENQKIAEREAQAKQEVARLEEQLEAVVLEKEAQKEKFDEALAEAQADTARQRLSFEEDRKGLEAEQQKLLTTQQEQKDFYQKELADRDAKITDLNERLQNNELALEKLLAERETATESFEVPDGRVSWVNQDGTVWINLGAADSLRRQITFSVYDPEMHDPAKATKKGSIEVTRILGDHMAEARITEDKSTDPIIGGDYVYSQVWHPGKKLRFALTGVIDIDGDSTHDVQRAIDLIQLNGGVVDSYLDDEGQQQGEMSVDTRYLVLGEFPEDALKAGFREGWSTMTEDANDKGVETILLAEFLNQMGYNPLERTVQLGSNSRAEDFTGAESSEENPTAKFRRRTPYRAPATRPY